ncbi:MAG: hypothetical protein AB1649_29580 [Chloroflexota bacterium]
MHHADNIDDLPPQVTPLERKARILSLLSYFGLAPFLWLFSSFDHKSPLFKHHLFHSLALSLAALSLNFLDLLPIITLVLIFGFDFQADFDTWTGGYGALQQVQRWVDLGVSIIALALNVAWIASLVGALLGKTWRIPIISKMASTNWMVSFAVVVSLLVDLASLAFIGIVADSVRIAKQPPARADVYVLYTMGGYIPVPGLWESYTPPGWAVTTAFYPLVRAGMARFGDDRVVVLPLTETTFNQAIQNGRFIFVASHGGSTPGTFATSFQPAREYGPWNVSTVYVGSQLQFVYFAGCEAGRAEAEWRRVLDVEDAIMFDRISYVTEHMLWIWFKSPGVIASLK